MNAQNEQRSSEGYYSGDPDRDLAPPQVAAAPNDATVSWEASEYLHHDKGAFWMILLVLIAVVLIGVAVWLQQWTFAVLLVCMAAAFGYYAFRKPRIMHYRLAQGNLIINDKSYPLADFSSFGVVEDGAFFSARLIPSKRFMPAVVVYFSENEGEAIVDILGDHLPMQQMQPDPLDTLMRKLRF